MTSFWTTPLDGKFNDDYCRVMLMVLVFHIFYKDWGSIGAFGILALCLMWALYQNYMRFRIVHG